MTLYFFYVFASLLWNALAAAAHRRHGGLRATRRRLTYVSFALSVAGLSWVGAEDAATGSSVLFYLSLSLPLAAFAAAAQTVAAARLGQRSAWLLAAYNAVLATVLVFRWLAAAGLEVGVVGEALSLSYAAFQSIIFLPALWFPMYVQIPWIARPSAAPQSVTRFVGWVGAAFGAMTVIVVLWVLPSSWMTISAWRSLEIPHQASPARSAALVRSSRILEPLLEPPTPALLERELSRLRELDLEAATVVMSIDLVEKGPGALGTLADFARANRSDGRQLILSLRGKTEWYRQGWPDSAGTVSSLGAAWRTAGSLLQPEISVVMGDPIAISVLVSVLGGPHASHGVLGALADSARNANPQTMVAAYGFEPWPGTFGSDSLSQARWELFRWAAGESSPVDRVGFALHPGFGDPEDFAASLDRLDSTLVHVGGNKKAWVFEFAVSPVTFGETAQRKHLEWVVSWARARPTVEGVSQMALGDYAERVGLVSARGKRRQAFQAYRDLGG